MHASLLRLIPFGVGIAMLGIWELSVHLTQVPIFVLPPPSAIGNALVDNFANGLEGTEIDFEKFHELVKGNQAMVNRLFTRMLEIFA